MMYSPFFKPIFWIIMGVLYVLMAIAAPLWAADLGLAMTWWKWGLAALWYLFLSYSIAGAMTLLGEREPGAWYRFLGFHSALTVVAAAVILWLVITV